jgi:hypothetical protein
LSCEYFQDAVSKAPPNSVSSLHEGQPAPDPLLSAKRFVDFNDTTVQIPGWIIPAAHSSKGQLNLLELELLHHYKSSTWCNFIGREDPALHAVHQHIVPRLSISHNYLLYALLSISANHRNALQPTKQLETQALFYRQKTFESYRKALQNLTSETYESILVTSTFLLSLLPPPEPEVDNDEEYIAWMYSMLKMSEGLRVLAGLRWNQGIEKLTTFPLFRREMRSLPPSPLVYTPDVLHIQDRVGALGTTPDHPNPAPTYPAIHLLSSFGNSLFLPPSLMLLLQPLIAQTGPIDLHRNTLIPVFHTLSPIFLSLYYHHINPDFFVRCLAFTSFLMPEFLALFKAREPRALLLMGWWFSLAGLLRNGWWVGDCTRRFVQAIGRILRQHGDPCIIEAFEKVERVVSFRDSLGREEAGKSVFDEWEGVNWEDGISKAAEWEHSSLEQGDETCFDLLDTDIPA